MKIPLVIAHGQEIFILILGIAGIAFVAGIVGLAVALGKPKEEISRVGACCGIAALLGSIWLLWIHGIPPPFLGVFSIIMFLPFPCALICLILSLRRKRKKA